MSRIKLPHERRNRTVPIRGEFHAVQSVGWQHGPIPKAPPGLLPETRATWHVWFESWVAAHWDPGDLPQLRLVIKLLDQIARGDERRFLTTELRHWLDGYGLTPKGQAERRWMRPVHDSSRRLPEPSDPYGHMRATRATSPAAHLIPETKQTDMEDTE